MSDSKMRRPSRRRPSRQRKSIELEYSYSFNPVQVMLSTPLSIVGVESYAAQLWGYSNSIVARNVLDKPRHVALFMRDLKADRWTDDIPF